MTSAWLPKTFTTLSGYTRRQFVADLQAGVVVGVVALPLAIAFAIASGVSPEKGLFTAVVAGLPDLGARRQPRPDRRADGRVRRHRLRHRRTHGVDGLTICTVLAGVLLIDPRSGRGFGAVIKFIPYPVVTGFTSGIAVIIFSSQIRGPARPADGRRCRPPFLEKWGAYGASLPTASPGGDRRRGRVARDPRRLAAGLAHAFPAPIVAILAATVAGGVARAAGRDDRHPLRRDPATLPAPRLPRRHARAACASSFPPALTIALLAGIESLLSAVVADGMIGSRHRSNIELVAQGVANIASPLFGGIPATGAIARTATNVKNGGRTPVAGIVARGRVTLAVLFLGRWAAVHPAGDAGRHPRRRRLPHERVAHVRAAAAHAQSDVAVLLTTFLLTVLVDLTVAVQVGMVLAAFLFMKRMADVTNVGIVTAEWQDAPDGTMKGDAEGVDRRRIPAGVEVYEINGPFFFGAADKIKDVLHFVAKKPKVFILRMRNVPAIDASGIRVLDDLFRSFSHQGIRFLISGIQAQPRAALERAGKLDEYGRENFVPGIDGALEIAAGHVAAQSAPEGAKA